MHLMTAGFFEWIIVPANWLTILTVLLGVGAVIFVHELGHFLVAKACGVRCDKFYIGFDIFGYKICKKWGETEYGIGILPLGGYVKMLGQDDNPAKAAEEMRRAKLRNDDGDSSQSEDSEAAALSQHDQELLDPRSYQAKSVPQRMAIISAGVVMNLIFGFIFAMVAYWIGVPYRPCVLDNIIPGDAASNAGQEPGIEYTELEGLKYPSYREISQTVGTSDDQSIINIQAIQNGKEVEYNLKPRYMKGMAKIGVLPSSSLVLPKENFTLKNTSAGNLKDGFQGRDRIILAGGVEIKNYQDLKRVQYEHRHESLKYRVLRGANEKYMKLGETAEDKQKGTEVDILVPANPMKTLGLQMTIGKIVALQDHSPAAAAGFKIDDQMLSIDGVALSTIDPLSLHDLFWEKARQSNSKVSIKVKRSGESQPVTIQVTPRKVDWYITAAIPKTPVSIPALGIAYQVTNKVQKVEPNSPAAENGLKPGDLILEASLLIDEESYEKEELKYVKKSSGVKKPITFNDDEPNWPYFVNRLQSVYSSTKVMLVYERAGEKKEVTLTPVISKTKFNTNRGIQLLPIVRIRLAESFADAIALAKREMWMSLTMVVRVLKSIDRMHDKLGGPGAIAEVAGKSAEQGFSTFLLFLAMLSANLAIINFLPIPILDGGHMVFLALEGIFRKPVSEKVFVIAQYIGLMLLLSLMLYVIKLDIFRILGLGE